jgi:hypothetical protein
MDTPVEAGEIFRVCGPAYRTEHGHEMPLRQLRAMNAVETCRTAALGGHAGRCEACGNVRVTYNSCRNRHCPKCQKLDKHRWVEARLEDLLPIAYYHVVFTIPAELRPLALRSQQVVYGILFRAASESLKQIAADPEHLGAQIGFIAMLHTWSRTLMDHPHLHCLVTGGGLSADGRKWISGRKGFFVPVRVVSALYRGKFLYYLKQAVAAGDVSFPGQLSELEDPAAFRRLLSRLYDKSWNVYCKRPFGSADRVVKYFGRYTHRVAISNERILSFDGETVVLALPTGEGKDRRKVLKLAAGEFIRRYLFHVLPERFVKIRYYGILGNNQRVERLERCRRMLGCGRPRKRRDRTIKRDWRDVLLELTGIDLRVCPVCGGQMVGRQVFGPQRVGGLPP